MRSKQPSFHARGFLAALLAAALLLTPALPTLALGHQGHTHLCGENNVRVSDTAGGVQTGDSLSAGLWAVAAILSLVVLAAGGLFYYEKFRFDEDSSDREDDQK